MQDFLKRIAKLIDVKSIISILTTLVFCYLALRKYLSAEVFISVYSIIIGFYFGTQYSKVQSSLENVNNNINENDNKEE